MNTHFTCCCLFLTFAMFTACDSGTSGTPDANIDHDAPLDAPGDAGDGCRDSADCTDNNTSCFGPNDVRCGIPPLEECQSDQDCAQPGDVCHAVYDACTADDVGSRCGPPCTQPSECGAGFTCNADGACRPILCDAADYDCRPSETCDPTSVDPDGPVPYIGHGCVNIPCTDDTPCPGDTVCVNSYCQDGPGTCELPAP